MLFAVQPLLASAVPPTDPPPVVAPAPQTALLEAEVHAALDAFQKRRFEAALSHFEKASTLTDDAAALLDIRFNAAVCLFELGRFAEAERRFVQLAKTDDSGRASEAWLHAGFAALRQSEPDRAERYSQRATLSTPAARGLAARLRSQLEAERRRNDDASSTAQLREGLNHLEHRRYEAAEGVLSQVARSGRAQPPQRAQALHGLAAIAQARGDSRRALVQLTAAIAETPGAPELYISRARVHASLGNAEPAKRDYDEAQRLLQTTDPSRAAQLQDEATTLYLLPPPGWHLGVDISAGYDSNVTQSGTASSFLTASAQSDAASPFIAGSGSVGYQLRPSERWALTPSYQLLGVAFTQSQSQPLSLLSHDLGAALSHATSLATTLSLSAGARYATSGLDAVPFTLQGYGQFTALWRNAPRWTGKAEFEYRRQVGLSAQDYLTGHAIDASVSERWAPNALRLGAELGVNANWLGTQQLYATEQSPQCQDGTGFGGPNFGGPDFGGGPGFGMGQFDDDCNAALVSNPLSYVAPHIAAYAELALDDHVLFSLFGSYEYKHYLRPSTVSMPGFVISEKNRRDRRTQLGVSLNWGPQFVPGLSVFGRYAFNVVRSNVALDTIGWRRAFTNDEQIIAEESEGYEQHLPEVGIGYRF